MINNWLCFAFQGTGKTWTGVEIACQFATLNRKQGNRGQVLFCAPSNHAVDVAASKCSLQHRRNFVLRLSVPHSPCRGAGEESSWKSVLQRRQLQATSLEEPPLVCYQKKGVRGDSLIGNKTETC